MAHRCSWALCAALLGPSAPWYGGLGICSDNFESWKPQKKRGVAGGLRAFGVPRSFSLIRNHFGAPGQSFTRIGINLNNWDNLPSSCWSVGALLRFKRDGIQQLPLGNFPHAFGGRGSVAFVERPSVV